MPKTIKWGLGVIAALLLVMLAYAVAGPWLAINGIRNVVASGDYGELHRFVDFDRLREDLRPQIQERIARGLVERIGPGQATKTLSRVTSMISDPAIDAMVSPVGIATLLHGTAMARRAAGQRDPDGKVRAGDPLKDAKTRYLSPSRFTATASNAEGKPVVFEFGRDGLVWKLVGIDLPD